jgi:hypothetical protein
MHISPEVAWVQDLDPAEILDKLGLPAGVNGAY